MKLVYTGTTIRKKSNCTVCSGNRTVNVLETTKEILCPSGKRYTFIVGRKQEVSNKEDAEFMLKLSFIKCYE